jgi:phage/plasmid-associated DNA primase
MNSQNLLSLQMSPSENLLDGITLYEPIDENILEKLINSTLLKDNFNNPFSTRFFTTEKQQLLKYKALIKNGKAVVNYNRSKNPYGRSNPDNALGLYSIRREIRHTLAKKRFTDIDINSAHPTFLYQILKANKEEIKCSFSMLEQYVLNRQKYLDEVMLIYGCNRDTAKNLFLILLFGGGFNAWIKKNTNQDKKTGEINLDISKVHLDYVENDKIIPTKEITEFKKEFDTLTKLIAKYNPDLCDQVKKIKTEQGKKNGEYNFFGSVCSFFLQEVEIRVLEIMFKHCIDNKYIKNDICVLCADGLMIETKYYNEKILKEFNQIVKEKTGLDLEFSTKEMNQDYLKTLDKNLSFDLYSQPFTTGLIADYFKVMFSNKFINVNGELYSFNGFVWKLEDKKHSSLHNFVDNVYYSHLNKYIYDFIAPITAEIAKVATQIALLKIQKDTVEDKQTIEKEIKEQEQRMKELEEQKKVYENFNKNLAMLRNIRFRKDYVNDIINKLKSDVVFDENPYLLAFNNKVYDLKTNSFIENPEYDLYIKSTTGYDWIKNYQSEKVDKLNKLIDTIFPNKDTKKYYLTALSTGLYGEQIENLFIASGKGGNGKSLINSLMLKTVGNYGYKLPSSVLLSIIKEGGNPQVAGMNRKRFVLCQEPDKNKRINTATLKEITGDKTLNTRMNFSNDCDTTLCLTLMMECNELPLLDEVNDAVQRRIRGIPFISRFVSQETYDELEDKTNVFVGDVYYKSDEFQEEYRQALMIILLEYWNEYIKNGMKLPAQPQECKKITNDYLATSDDIYDWFRENYERNNEVNEKEQAKHILKIKDVCEHYKVSAYFLNMNKKDKREFNESKFREKIQNNLFLKQFYKERQKYKIDDKYNSSPILINWILKKEDTEEYN